MSTLEKIMILDMEQDAQAARPVRGRLRHLRHPHHHRLSEGAGEDAVLDGLFHRQRHLHAEHRAYARLDNDSEVERLRIAAHDRFGGRRQVGRDTDTLRTHGRRRRTRHRGALALQGGESGRTHQRTVALAVARTARRDQGGHRDRKSVV